MIEIDVLTGNRSRQSTNHFEYSRLFWISFVLWKVNSKKLNLNYRNQWKLECNKIIYSKNRWQKNFWFNFVKMPYVNLRSCFLLKNMLANKEGIVLINNNEQRIINLLSWNAYWLKMKRLWKLEETREKCYEHERNIKRTNCWTSYYHQFHTSWLLKKLLINMR